MSAADRAAPSASPGGGKGGPAVRVSGVRKTFGDVVAVSGVHLDVARGETLALLGPSGCGKTTLLRAIAGLERPVSGTIEIAGRLVDGPGVFVPPERRRVGMVFQDIALFPHLSVAENIAYGIARMPAPERTGRVGELLELVGLADAGRLRPHELSGGMQQRVALARALAPRPDVLLLDEPFANLDLSLRTQLRGEVRRVLDVTGTTALLVTHDQAEALTLGDRVAVMRRGGIDQVGSPEEIYGDPETPFVATFVGIANLLPGHVEDGEARTVLGRLRVRPMLEDGHALVVVRPEHAELVPDEAGTEGVIGRGHRGRIVGRRFAGSELLFEVALDGDAARLWVEAGTLGRRLVPGDRVRVALRVAESVAFRSRPAG